MKLIVEFDGIEEIEAYLSWIKRGKSVDDEKSRVREVQEKWGSTEVSKLGLSARVEDLLRRMGVDTVERMMALTEWQCAREPSFGRKAWAEILRVREDIKNGVLTTPK